MSYNFLLHVLIFHGYQFESWECKIYASVSNSAQHYMYYYVSTSHVAKLLSFLSSMEVVKWSVLHGGGWSITHRITRGRDGPHHTFELIRRSDFSESVLLLCFHSFARERLQKHSIDIFRDVLLLLTQTKRWQEETKTTERYNETKWDLQLFN